MIGIFGDVPDDCTHTVDIGSLDEGCEHSVHFYEDPLREHGIGISVSHVPAYPVFPVANVVAEVHDDWSCGPRHDCARIELQRTSRETARRDECHNRHEDTQDYPTPLHRTSSKNPPCSMAHQPQGCVRALQPARAARYNEQRGGVDRTSSVGVPVVPAAGALLPCLPLVDCEPVRGSRYASPPSETRVSPSNLLSAVT